MSKKQYTDIDCQNSAKIINLPTPTNPNDAVNKSYADSIGGGTGQTYRQVSGATFLQ